MKIRCVNGKNTKLIEGQIYDACYILGNRKLDKSGNRYWIGVKLYNGSSYSSKVGLSKFETLDGRPLTEIYIDEEPSFEERNKLIICPKNISQEELLKTWIIYKGGNASKYFVTNNIYKVVEINNEGHYYYPESRYRVKIEGFEHFWTGTDSFKLLNKQEMRDLKIDVIDGKEVVTNNFTRKFDAITVEEQIKVMMNALMKARKEFARNDFKDITMEEYIVNCDNKYGITLEDVEKFKKVKIPELFN